MCEHRPGYTPLPPQSPNISDTKFNILCKIYYSSRQTCFTYAIIYATEDDSKYKLHFSHYL